MDTQRDWGLEKTVWMPLRPDRPIPEELLQLLRRAEADDLPPEAHILRIKKGITINSGAYLLSSCVLAAAAVAMQAYLFTNLQLWTVGAFAFAIAFGVVGIHRMTRESQCYLLVTPRFLAHVDGELEVQWAEARELSAVSEHAHTVGSAGAHSGGGGTNTPAYLELVFKNSDTEEIFVDPLVTNRELRSWRAACERILRLGEEQRAIGTFG